MSGIVCTCGTTTRAHEWDCPADGFESAVVPSEAGKGEPLPVCDDDACPRAGQSCPYPAAGCPANDDDGRPLPEVEYPDGMPGLPTPRPAEPDAGEVDALTDVLFAHRLHASMNHCLACRWRPTAGDGGLADQHARHVATVIGGYLAARDARVRRETERALLRDLARGLYPRAVVSLGEGAPWVRLARWQAARLAAALFDDDGAQA